MRNLNKNMEDKIKLTIHAAGIGERLPIPLAGQSVKAGFPSPAQDYMEGEIDLNESGTFGWLIPWNKAYTPIRVDETNRFMIWGVVTYVIHRIAE